MWTTLLNLLLQYVVPELGKLLIAFISAFRQTAGNDPVLVAYAQGIVQAMEDTHLTGEEKYKGAFDSLKGYAKQLGIDLKDSAVDVLIHLAVAALPQAEKK